MRRYVTANVQMLASFKKFTALSATAALRDMFAALKDARWSQRGNAVKWYEFICSYEHHFTPGQHRRAQSMLKKVIEYQEGGSASINQKLSLMHSYVRTFVTRHVDNYPPIEEFTLKGVFATLKDRLSHSSGRGLKAASFYEFICSDEKRFTPDQQKLAKKTLAIVKKHYEGAAKAQAMVLWDRRLQPRIS